MTVSNIEKAASRFGTGQPLVEAFGTGLINHSYKVTYPDGKSILLQCINQTTFRQPENIIHNYRLLSDYTTGSEKFVIPALVQTNKGKYFWIDDSDNFWRATYFVPNSYADDVAGSAKDVYLAARCFARFTASLNGLDPEKLEVIIPRFHDLDYRYEQFEQAITTGAVKRLLKATHVIASLRERYHLVEFYRSVKQNDEQYPIRIMHHDCKISNILFDKSTHEVICPVDLDTVMPGKYYSDIGDMIRTMACSREENSVEWEHIDIVPEYYQAIIKGYLDGTGGLFTEQEIQNLHYAGQLLIYMQCLRFVTDFINNDIYYKTTYDEQNLNRALNQLVLLEKLENHLQSELVTV
jgi:hypothetical protein